MSLKIFFGPYEAHGVIRHKTQKLYGLLTKLSELGYELELIATNRLNNLTIHLRDKQIYRCDLRYLMFNIDYEDDPVCQNIVKSVEETRALFDAEQNLATFDTLKKNYKGDTRDLLAEDVDLMFEIPHTYEEFKIRSTKKASVVRSLDRSL
ncbi:UPF0728 protein C10orf53 homolog [Tribolium castaneum]|uniref:Uncharacterized protein n=1 Tax=Tribolium castaneum TaxID=7070 RepID=D6WJK3_TRICA|nr:PREDICTED: UPF0728 protein C10orf53 homolog [Tribolium castaneum]EFA03664.1 hypothetical protein TcasGA2_TC013761 [Tribolium castaneum]|eukprot:XP_008193095.1 PREDICTED: UPF0728 protein C10orf53 homolog [Tribolium castaneum]